MTTFEQETKRLEPKQFQTYSATEDDLLCNLMCRNEVVIVNKGKRKTLAKKYNRQAISIILHHSRTSRVNDFVINLSDLTTEVKEELTLDRIRGTKRQYYKIFNEILCSVVQRLFENLDLVYYHDHLASRIKVRLDK
jgi:hypothetical protein